MSEDKSIFEKSYRVYIQKSFTNESGYIYLNPKHAPKASPHKSFEMVYYFRKIPKQHNPMLVIDEIDGDDFKERMKIISHFETNHALEYSVANDGLYKGLGRAEDEQA